MLRSRGRKKSFDAAQANEAMLRESLSQEEQKAFDNGQKGIQFEFARSQYRGQSPALRRIAAAPAGGRHHCGPAYNFDSRHRQCRHPHGVQRARTKFNLAIGTILGLMLGFGVALLLESLDTNLKTMTDIEQALLQMPLLAAIPAVEEDELIPSTFREAAVSKARPRGRGLQSLCAVCAPRSCFPAPALLRRCSWSRARDRRREKAPSQH